MHPEPGQDKSPGRKARSARPSETFLILGRLSGLGMEILASILGLGVVGWLIDGQAGTAPWGLVIGLTLGAVGGVYNATRRSRYFFEADWKGRNTPPHDDPHP